MCIFRYIGVCENENVCKRKRASLVILGGYVPEKSTISGLLMHKYNNFPSLSAVFAHFTIGGESTLQKYLENMSTSENKNLKVQIFNPS